MSSDSTPQEEAAAFTDMVGRYINEFVRDENIGRKVEAAIVDLEVQHTKHINAVKREFNAELAKIEAAQQHNLSILHERQERHERDSQKQVRDITNDYKSQIQQISEGYHAELLAVKNRYENMLAERDHMSKTVAEVQERCDKELKHLAEEHQRIVELKEKDIEALNRRIESTLTNAGIELNDVDMRRRMSEDENSTLRKDVAALQMELSTKNEHIMDLLKSTVEDNERTLALCKKLASEVDDAAAQTEVDMSQIRAILIADTFERIRAKIREGEAKATAKAGGPPASANAERRLSTSGFFTPNSLTREIDVMESTEQANRQRVEERMDSIQEKLNAQKGAVTVFKHRVEEALLKSREQYQKQQDELEKEVEHKRRESANGANSSRNDVVFSLHDADGQVKDMHIRRARRASSSLSLRTNSAHNRNTNSESGPEGDSPAAR